MSHPLFPGRRTTAALLVLAPLGELVEAFLSPLDGSSTVRDLDAIAAHQSMYVLSAGIGLVATVLYVPAFVGLAATLAGRSPRLATWAGWLAVYSMAGFFAVRFGQAIELSAVREHLDHASFARVIDGTAGTWLGAPVLVMFLLGAFSALVLFAVAGWRAGMPKVACILLGCFQVVDLGMPERFPLGEVSHVLLAVALGWFALALTRDQVSPGAEPAVRQEAVRAQ